MILSLGDVQSYMHGWGTPVEAQQLKVTYNIIAIIPARAAAIIPASLEKPLTIPCHMIMTNTTAGIDMYQYMKKSVIPSIMVTIQRDNCSIKIFPFYPPLNYNFHNNQN